VGLSIFVALIFNYSNSLSGIPVLSWLGELANEFKSRDLTSWSLLSGIFGSRFEIWEAAIRMWWEFPLMGIGQGNFYRLSDIASFSKSHFLILNHGENAHNYFLQTLTETGAIGVAVFALALLAPFFGVENRRILFPAVIAILSLFLGNIFSHSFLVRENLYLLSVMLGCIYSMSGYKLNSIHRSSKLGSAGQVMYVYLLVSALVITLLSITVHEVHRSFGRAPFERGFYCFEIKNIDDDGWILGGWKFPLPRESSNVEIEIRLPPSVDLSAIDGNGLIATIQGSNDFVVESTIKFNRLGFASIHFKLDDNQKDILGKNIALKIQTRSCYTPRNKGESVDARRLGVRIESMYINGSKIR
jgi:hypothetical protein